MRTTLTLTMWLSPRILKWCWVKSCLEKDLAWFYLYLFLEGSVSDVNQRSEDWMMCSWMLCGVPAAGYCCVSRSCNIQHKFFHILRYLFIRFCVCVLCCIVIDVSSFQRNALPIPISHFFEAVSVNVIPWHNAAMVLPTAHTVSLILQTVFPTPSMHNWQ